MDFLSLLGPFQTFFIDSFADTLNSVQMNDEYSAISQLKLQADDDYGFPNGKIYKKWRYNKLEALSGMEFYVEFICFIKYDNISFRISEFL